jgi:small-conductance mechanosensitive channel
MSSPFLIGRQFSGTLVLDGFRLDFRLLVWTRQPSRHPQIKSDINYRIEQLFRESGIEIPYPKQEFLLRQIPPAAEADDLLSDDRASKDSLDNQD